MLKDKAKNTYQRAPKGLLPHPMESFLKHHQLIDGRRNDYTLLRRHFHIFSDYLNGEKLYSLDHGSAQGFVTWLGEHYNQYSAGYLQNILKSVKRLYRHLSEEEKISRNPFLYVKGPKVKRILPRQIPQDKEIRSLLRSVPLTAMRDRAVIELLYGSGIRISELINLSVNDLSEDGWIHITDAKSKKERNVPVSTQSLFAITAYCQGEREELLQATPDYTRTREIREPDETRLFIKAGGFPLCQWSITSMIDQYVKKAYLEKHITAHSFRHACAREMLKGGASVRYVQKMLGHNSISTTMIYTRLSAREVQQALDAFHPRGEKQNEPG
jgi:integrase/recombinase XerD